MCVAEGGGRWAKGHSEGGGGRRGGGQGAELEGTQGREVEGWVVGSVNLFAGMEGEAALGLILG